MTYLVLARKWRPRSFDALIGQDHVVRALTHALSTQRLHHAWLFTGTRGVGKTTLSRILAKSLNCETGITPTPCGVCQVCTEIDAGRFVDYVELDAASNRGVEEMTQLLEQAVYAPSSGRFKVYMIDEVHMLTGHAFNAMLKTLEEPPAHVKFILATTDPQKIPVTVLSRCLQFNLKQMTAEAIVGHLQGVLDQESIRYETPALRLLAQAASGSMRDALSLTDQAIAYSAGDLSSDAVRGMLGTIDQRHLVSLLQALAAGSAAQVLSVADELAERGLSYSGALADLAVLLSRIAIEQRIPGATQPEDPLASDIAELAGMLHADQVQLFYSVAVHSRGELSLAPDEYAGFVMACLRMLSLVPDGGPGQGPAPSGGQPTSGREVPAAAESPSAAAVAGAGQASAASVACPASDMPAQVKSAGNATADASVSNTATMQQQGAHTVADEATDPASSAHDESESTQSGKSGAAPAQRSPEPAHDDVPAWEDAPSPPPPSASDADTFETMSPDDAYFDDARFIPADGEDGADEVPGGYALREEDGAGLPAGLAPGRKRKHRQPRPGDITPQTWPALAAALPLTGLAAELARQSEWVSAQGDAITLRVAIRSLAESGGRARLRTVLSEHFGAAVQLNVEYGVTGDDTAHAVEQAWRADRQREAEQAVANDPFVQALISEFGARVVPGSISATLRQRAA
ncbi:DNA polymerase III subunit gamma/tau [Allopusillimonas soli]|uniref:DNA polymerase III subunit gamma/tau n=1 Tax=Allopusillimonas soli TaxID=659016 RepID=A0A853FES3_9BURK|nr:DNA polymerase III subunit gamma/tau [Allopusillimonas soli]NYT38563.1 DNA polymerase III subunit gamma/tau [Allopusillimonas soli]TEA71722.1 DNA polymerase III subunit gamma/tau [Allopusillimonas soli]